MLGSSLCQQPSAAAIVPLPRALRNVAAGAAPERLIAPETQLPPLLPALASVRRRAVVAQAPSLLALLATTLQVLPAAAEAEPGDTASFYSLWPYVEPADILPYLRASVDPRDPAESVLQAIDRFAGFYPMYR